MPSTIQPINLTNFTGGLNLRADAFELDDGESPSMLNVDIDPRGGFYSRKGWLRWGFEASDTQGFDGGSAWIQGLSLLEGGDATVVGGDIISGNYEETIAAGLPTLLADWNPRSMFVHELQDGSERVYLANDGNILYSDDGLGYTVLDDGLTPITVACSPHLADFAPWGDDIYVAAGRDQQACKIDDVALGTLLTATAAGTFTTYASPSTDVFPACQLVAAHAGYMFAADMEEDGSYRPSRVRWSHPNNPGAWHVDDYIDIFEGGGRITALVPMQDHLLIFKPSSVWALFGYNSESWQLVNVSREVGAVHRQAVARSESAVFFYAHPRGVFAIGGDGNFPVEISQQLRPALDGANFNSSAFENIWLGWIDQRLWVSLPYSEDSVALDATTAFVFDPSIGNGAWNAYRAADGGALGPFAQGGFGGDQGLNIAAARKSICVMRVDAIDRPVDDAYGVPQAFESFYVTRWVNGNYPALKKSWRRPDIIAKERSEEYLLTVEAYHNYDEANSARSRTLVVDAGSGGALWGSFVWGDGTRYGAAAKGSRIERGGSLGTAAAMQLRISGEQSKSWGVDAIVFKVKPRRFR